MILNPSLKVSYPVTLDFSPPPKLKQCFQKLVSLSSPFWSFLKIFRIRSALSLAVDHSKGVLKHVWNINPSETFFMSKASYNIASCLIIVHFLTLLSKTVNSPLILVKE